MCGEFYFKCLAASLYPSYSADGGRQLERCAWQAGPQKMLSGSLRSLLVFVLIIGLNKSERVCLVLSAADETGRDWNESLHSLQTVHVVHVYYSYVRMLYWIFVCDVIFCVQLVRINWDINSVVLYTYGCDWSSWSLLPSDSDFVFPILRIRMQICHAITVCSVA